MDISREQRSLINMIIGRVIGSFGHIDGIYALNHPICDAIEEIVLECLNDERLKPIKEEG